MGGQVAKYVFMPPPCTYTDSKPYPVIWLPTKTGKKVPAYWLCHKKRKTNLTIIYSHGNAADIGAMFELLVLFYEHLGVNVLHYDYLGYGLTKESHGFPSEESTYESIEAAHSFLTGPDCNIENKDILLFGTSVGSGPTCHLGAREKVLGVILECPFLSCIRVVTNNILLRPIDMFVNINKVGKFSSPTFILHGSIDQVIAQDHGRELFANLPENYQYPPKWINGANHHDIIDTMTVEVYINSLKDFILHCKEQQGGKTLKTLDSNLKIVDKIELVVKKDIDTGYDTKKTVTAVQIRLTDGSTIHGKFNNEQKILAVYLWVSTSISVPSDKFCLLASGTGTAKVKLEDLSDTVEKSKIGGSTLIMTMK